MNLARIYWLQEIFHLYNDSAVRYDIRWERVYLLRSYRFFVSLISSIKDLDYLEKKTRIKIDSETRSFPFLMKYVTRTPTKTISRKRIEEFIRWAVEIINPFKCKMTIEKLFLFFHSRIVSIQWKTIMKQMMKISKHFLFFGLIRRSIH